jgi:hypothetical protein
MKFPLGSMTVGDILDRGIKLTLARLPVFYAINLLVLLPAIAIQVVVPFILPTTDVMSDPTVLFTYYGGMLVAELVRGMLQPFATAAILFIVMEEYAGRRPTMGQALGFAVSRFFALLVASFLYGLMLTLGFVACCAPGLWVLAVFPLFGQALLLERLGIGASFARSSELTRDYRWRVLGVLILVMIVAGVTQGVITQVLTVAIPPQEIIPAGNRGQMKVLIHPVNHAIVYSVSQLVGIVLQTFLAVCTTLLYLDLRIRKEGFDLELAAQLGEEPREPEPDRPRRRRRRDDDDYDDESDESEDRPRRRRRDDDRDEPDDRDRPRRDDRDEPDDRGGPRRPRGDDHP